jgi:putative transport protein
MNTILDMLRARPEVALFVALGVGYLVGKLHLGSFRLGPVTGCLLAGVVIGQFGITVSPHLQ